MVSSHDIKMEVDDDGTVAQNNELKDGSVTLDATMEYCRNIGWRTFHKQSDFHSSTVVVFSGEIPTYGLAGNRTDAIDVSEMKHEEEEDTAAIK